MFEFFDFLFRELHSGMAALRGQFISHSLKSSIVKELVIRTFASSYYYWMLIIASFPWAMIHRIHLIMLTYKIIWQKLFDKKNYITILKSWLIFHSLHKSKKVDPTLLEYKSLDFHFNSLSLKSQFKDTCQYKQLYWLNQQNINAKFVQKSKICHKKVLIT